MKRISVAASLTLAAAFVLVLFAGCRNNKNEISQNDGWSRKLDTELYLRAEGQTEKWREVDYWPGTRTLKAVTVFFSNGGKQVSTYRKNGTPSQLTEWYPHPSLVPAPPPDTTSTPLATTAPADPAGAIPVLPSIPLTTLPGTPVGAPVAPTPAVVTTPAPPVPAATTGSVNISEIPDKFGRIKRQIEYGEDGKTVLHARFFRADGTSSAFGRLLPDGMFEHLDYSQDGKAITRHQVFTKPGDIVFLRAMEGDPVKSLTRKLANGSEETVVFGDNGLRQTRTFRNLSNSFEDIEFYKEDGVTLRTTVYRQYSISALYYKADGTVDYYRTFTWEGMTVVKYRDGAGKTIPQPKNGANPLEAYRQYWKSVKDAAGNETYVLDRVEEIGADGKVARKLSFSATGKLTKVDYFDKDNNTTKVVILRDDETVERIDDYVRPQGGGTTTITPTNIEQSRGLRETFDGKLTQPAPFEDARKLVGPPIQPVYECHEGWYEGCYDGF